MDAAAAEKKMMRGSEGKLDYIVIARRGPIALGLKPNVIAAGRVDNTTYIGARIRSAKLPMEDTSLVSLADMKLTPENAWTGIEWEKSDEERCSTQIGAVIKGNLKETPKLLLTEFTDNDLMQKMVDYTMSLAPAGSHVITSEELLAWLKAFYTPIIQHLSEKAMAEAALDEEIGSTLGVFSMQAQQVKKALKKASAASKKEEVEDFVDDVDDVDDGDDD